MMAQNYALGELSHDIFFINGQLAMVDTVDNYIQRLKVRLQVFLGEWYLDTSKGLPFFAEILIKNPDIPNIDSLIKAQIIDTPGTQELLEYGSTYNRKERTFSVTFRTRSIFGEVEFNETIFGTETP